jgi:tetratricopeptide (TPR) repeat protein
MVKQVLKVALVSMALFYFQPGFAGLSSSAQTPEVREIQFEWARLYYMDEFLNVNYRELEALVEKANQVAAEYPQNAEALVWDAIVMSTMAEKKGGLGALSLVKQARLKLEEAEAIDPTVLGGSVYASLGTLYSKVPGWPFGFGSDEKAEEYFKKALAINPQGLDINYFFAEYLADNGDQQLALVYVDKALQAPRMAERPVADKGRREQALKLRESLTGS